MMRSRTILTLAGVLVTGFVLGRWVTRESAERVSAQDPPQAGSGKAAGSGPKPATDATKKANAAFAKTLNFDDKRDFEDAKRGFLAPLPDGGVVMNDKGAVVFDVKNFTFPLDAKAPDTVNPSLWRQCQLNGHSGLFKVVDRIYQVRSIDISNITFIEGDKGVIIVDPLVSAEPAKVALDLYYQHRPKKPVVAVIYTHSHTDHYGGVRGVISGADVEAGKVKVIAPEHFTEEAVSETLLAGNAMKRRATFMFGRLIPNGPQGNVGSGLGTGGSSGSVTLIPPTAFITQTGQKMTIDGLEFEFLMAPGSEAPAEMHFYIPSLKALCTAENAVHTLHNAYTLRGAKTRDTKKWVGYLNQTLDLWGDKAEVLFAPHTWPVWGNARVVEHIENYRDTFRYIHDQSLRLANQGYTMLEIAEMVELPDSLAKNWASRGYYGSVRHNAKAVYNFYLGYFSANAADLNPLPPVESGKRHVELMGGAANVIKAARQAYDRGDYRWAAEVLKHVVYADPKNQEARNLQADAFEQLGYQAENATWRNGYLTGAQELRKGVVKALVANPSSADVIDSIPLDLFFDFLAIQLNGPRAAEKEIVVNFDFTDLKEQYALTVKNGVLNSRKKLAAKADATVTLTRTALNDVLLGEAKLPQLVTAGDIKIAGNAKAPQELLSLLEPFELWFNIVTPNPPPLKARNQ
jgi:alkyl sulfatase BDS1-like metallo-beta-lactamase superfamily hydrolase